MVYTVTRCHIGRRLGNRSIVLSTRDKFTYELHLRTLFYAYLGIVTYSGGSTRFQIAFSERNVNFTPSIKSCFLSTLRSGAQKKSLPSPPQACMEKKLKMHRFR